MKRIALSLMLMAAVAVLLTPSSTRAQPSPPKDVAARCQALASADFSGVVDAPTQVMTSKLVKATGALPAYCEVHGYITPNVGIEIKLPTENWNGKYAQIGCGGFCGTFLSEYCGAALLKGYVCVLSDTGHKSTIGDGKWAYNNNLQAAVDYGFRSTHVAALAGKAITKRYYSKAPAKSYLYGCSYGGHEGFVEAQRFPWDFDGIIAGAPNNTVSGNFTHAIWLANTLLDKTGKPVLSEADFRIVHNAAVAKCDMDDGVKDGIIGNPPACAFDPAELVCKPGSGKQCLTEAKTQAMKKAYGGPTTSRGEKLYTGGVQPGGEIKLSGFYFDNYVVALATEFFRYAAFWPSPGPTWHWRDFDFDRDYKRLGMMEAMFTASNPDLRQFKAAGGKLISYVGWNDVGTVPLNLVDYYKTTERTIGGREATQDFFRLYAVPGMDHCYGGDGAYAIDYLSYLEAWVEHGKAPDVMMSVHPKVESASEIWGLTTELPSDPAQYVFTRPVYPYPLRAKYKGSGDPNNAANFGPIDEQGSWLPSAEGK